MNESVEKNNDVFRKVEVEFPIDIMPVLTTIETLTGIPSKEFINLLLKQAFETLYKNPFYLFEFYTDYSKSIFFNMFKTGLDQWITLKQPQEKDHTQEAKICAPT